MRVTQWGELGVLCTLEVAKAGSEAGKSLSAVEIATTLRIDIQYAQQILHRLKKGLVLKSVRGPKGGYSLERSPEKTTLGEILLAAEGQTFEVFCETKPLDEERCNPSHNCNLRPIWYRLREHINEFLSSVTLQDLITSPVEQILVQIQSTRDRRQETVC
jgi:Rrf2 family protein